MICVKKIKNKEGEPSKLISHLMTKYNNDPSKVLVYYIKAKAGSFYNTLDELEEDPTLIDYESLPTSIETQRGPKDYDKIKKEYEVYKKTKVGEVALVNILNRLEKKFNVPYTIVNDLNDNRKGYYQNDRVFVNIAKVTADTAFHEFAHPWVALIKRKNKPLYNNLNHLL